VQLSDNVPAGQKPEVMRLPPASAVVGAIAATAIIAAKVKIAMPFIGFSPYLL
jgi:hypothetical protein